MKQAAIHTDKSFKISQVDKRMFGSFLEHMGRAIYEGIYQPESPFADEDGIRTDVLKAVRELGVTVVRYPGGNMVSAYNWEDGVGPKELRPVRLEAAWQNLEDNDFGTNEFMDWAGKAGIQPMMAVNLGTRGVEAARNLLEYCNYDSGTYYSDLRIKHGYRKPHNVKLWCLGNEMDGPWQIGHRSAREYGILAMQTAKIMKDIDPEVELAACGSAGRSLPTFGEWDATVAEICYRYIDFLSVHTYFDNRNVDEDDSRNFIAHDIAFADQIESVIASCDYAKTKTKSKKKLYLSIDEWNVVYRPHGKIPADARWTKAPHQIEDVYSLEDALLVGNMLITMLNHADRVKIGCLAQLVNVVAPIMTSDGSCWKQPIFYPFRDCSRYAKGAVLKNVVDCERYDAKRYKDVPYVNAAVVYDEEAERLAIFAVNRDLCEDSSLTVDLRQFAGYRVEKQILLNHEDIKAVNTEHAPDHVHDTLATRYASVEGGVLSTVLEKHSWNVILLSKEES